MSDVLDSISSIARSYPDKIALESTHSRLSYAELEVTLADLSSELVLLSISGIGLLAENGIPWALLDLSALALNIPIVPLPIFFSQTQIWHAIRDSGLDYIFTDKPEFCSQFLQQYHADFEEIGRWDELYVLKLLNSPHRQLPTDTQKITYTSGSTNEPKGVCLSKGSIEQVLKSLVWGSEAIASDHHVCVTPLSTLLENLSGIYVPLMVGATVYLPTMNEVGLHGVTSLDVVKMITILERFKATTLILAPQMLFALVMAAKHGLLANVQLRFVAVGGAPVSSKLLEQAKQVNIPVFEGYGLSECGSVVALNTPQFHKIGSVGKPLSHIKLSIKKDGEILIEDPAFISYLGKPAPPRQWPTGDIGYLDMEGYLYITGRKRSMYITSFGRNLSPEWIESELSLNQEIAQIAVFGDERPFNTAIVFPGPACRDEAIQAAIESSNSSLPDYARIKAWIKASQPFSITNQQITSNGRLRRDAIRLAYADQLEQLYKDELNDVF
jgi:long-subunit acyl-CoA synthetase (AMP-forming)